MELTNSVGASFYLAGEKPIPGPMVIAAAATGDKSIRITWPAVANAVRYNIQRQTSGGGWIGVGFTSDLLFDDVGLTAETTYEHRAFAENADGVWGPASNVTSTITDVAPQVPGPVPGFVVVGTAMSYDLSWGAADRATTYIVSASSDGSSWVTPVDVGNVLNYSDGTGIAPGNKRYYRILGRNAAGDGPWSATVDATIPVAGAPGKILNPAVVATTTEFTVTWDKDADATTYLVGVSFDGTVWEPGADVGDVNFIVDDYQITTGQQRWYRILGQNANGDGPWSDVVNDTTPVGEIIPPETDLPTYDECTKYVSAIATGGGVGTLVDPWTLTEAMAQATAGDKVGIKAGLYVGTHPGGVGEQLRLMPAFAPVNSGTVNNRIYFISEYWAALNGMATPVAQRTDIRSGGTDIEFDPNLNRNARRGWPAFGAKSSVGAFITWVGIYSDCYEPNNMLYEDCGICTIRSVVGCSVRYCYFRGAPVGTDWANGNNYSGIRFEQADYSHAADNWFDRFAKGPANNTGIMMYYCANVTLEHNFSEECTHGLYPKRGLPDVMHSLIARYNHAKNCAQGIRLLGPNRNTSVGVRSVIHNNLWEDCEYGIEIPLTTPGPTDIKDTDIFNNTTIRSYQWQASLLRIYSPTDPDANCRIFNNILYDSRYYLAGGGSPPGVNQWAQYSTNRMEYDVDLIQGVTSVTLSQWQNDLGQDVDSILDDPQFVDYANADYRLSPGSPCENTGVDLAGLWGPVGGVVNMGCYVTGDEVIGIRRSTTPITKPDAVTDLVATATGSTTIGLTWSAAARATSYRLEASVDGGNTYPDSVTVSTPGFNSPGLTPDTEYFYRVFAINSAGDSLVSNIVSATTDAESTGLPDKVLGIAVVATDLEFTITWTKTPTADTYIIEYSFNGVDWTDQTDIGNVDILVDAWQITPGEQRFYHVRGRNTVGDGPWSDTVEDTTPSGVIYGDDYAILINAPSDNYLYTIPASDAGSYDALVSWGDGTADSTITAWDDPNLAHTYALAGDYIQRVSGTFRSVNYSNSPNKDDVKEVLNLGSGLASLSGAYRTCNALTRVTSDKADTSTVSTWYTAFQYATALTYFDIGSMVANGSMLAAFRNTGPYTRFNMAGMDVSNANTFDEFLLNSSIPLGDYSDGLVAWAGLTLQPDMVFDGGSSQYDDLGETARQSIIDAYGWTFIDGGNGQYQTLMGTTQPTGKDITDGVPYEMGMRFRVAVPGKIVGVRTFKATSEPAGRTGHLWTAAGVSLGSVAFVNESPGGQWTSQKFDTPIAIQADTEYMVSVSINTHYVVTLSGLATDMVNGDITGIGDGANMVVGLNPGEFPQDVPGTNNLFTDIMFEAD